MTIPIYGYNSKSRKIAIFHRVRVAINTWHAYWRQRVPSKETRMKIVRRSRCSPYQSALPKHLPQNSQLDSFVSWKVWGTISEASDDDEIAPMNVLNTPSESFPCLDDGVPQHIKQDMCGSTHSNNYATSEVVTIGGNVEKPRDISVTQRYPTRSNRGWNWFGLTTLENSCISIRPHSKMGTLFEARVKRAWECRAQCQSLWILEFRRLLWERSGA